MKDGDVKMKKLLGLLSITTILILVLTACTEDEPQAVEARAVFELDRLILDENEEIYHGHGTPFSHAKLTFVGEEQGGNVLIQIGDTVIGASINPSREHPSFESGYWHHHLYAGSTESGSPRINFQTLLPELGIDDNPDATDDNTQSAYQRGNLHYIVETGEFRLRLMIDGIIHDLIFTEV